MAPDRMAEGGSRTCEVLAFNPASKYKAKGTGCPRQTALDHRTELRGTEAGTRTRPLRRPGLARIPSSRHALYRGIRLPRGREKPFPPPHPSAISDYRRPPSRQVSARADQVRPERHNRLSIATTRIQLSRNL